MDRSMQLHFIPAFLSQKNRYTKNRSVCKNAIICK